MILMDNRFKAVSREQLAISIKKRASMSISMRKKILI